MFAILLTLACAPSGPPLDEGWYRWEAESGQPTCYMWESGDDDVVIETMMQGGDPPWPQEVEVEVGEDGGFRTPTVLDARWRWVENGEALELYGLNEDWSQVHWPVDCEVGEVWWE